MPSMTVISKYVRQVMDAGKRRQPSERRQLTTQSSDQPGRIMQGTEPCLDTFSHPSALSFVA